MADLSLKELKNLQDDNEIDLSARQLLTVPRSLHLVSRLTHIDLGSNKIAFLPNELCTMTKLIKLELGNNKLHHLPHDFGNLINLQHLDLYNNEIEELPLSFANLKSLKWLDLKKNPLELKLSKAAGNCGNEKECKEAAAKVISFVNEQKKFVEYQKEKQEKVLAKIQEKNIEEKKKNRQNEEKKRGNAKSNGVAQHQKEVKTTQQPQKVSAEKTKKTSPAKKASSDKPVRRSFIGGVFRLIFSLFYYATIATLGAATVSVLLNCSDGGKSIAGSKPLCADLTKLASFTKPSPQFLTNARNTYGSVLNGYKRTVQPYTKPVTKKIDETWKNFVKTDLGKSIEKNAYKVHAWIVEHALLTQRFVQKKYNELVAWYNKEGHKTFGAAVESVKVASLVVLEVVKDIAQHVIEVLSYVAARAQKFVHAWMEGGYHAAMKTLN